MCFDTSYAQYCNGGCREKKEMFAYSVALIILFIGEWAGISLSIALSIAQQKPVTVWKPLK